MDERALSVHQVELVVQPGPGFSDSGGVGQHADGTLYLGQIAAGDDGGRLVVDTDLETGGTPVDKLDGPLGLNGSNGGVDVLGHDVTAVQHATSHVFAVARVAFHHLVGRFKAGVGNFGYGQLFVVGLFGGNDRRVCDQREMDARVRHQIGLELGQVDVEGTVETQGRGDRRDDLADETVQVGVGRALDVEITAADVVDGLVVNHERAVAVLQGRVRGQDRVVRLDDGGGHLRGRIDGEFQFALLAVVHAQPFHKQRRETGTGATAERVKDQETLQTGTLVSQFPHPVQNDVDDFFADGVVSTSVVVGGVLLAGDQLFGMEKLTVSSSSHLVCVRG